MKGSSLRPHTLWIVLSLWMLSLVGHIQCTCEPPQAEETQQERFVIHEDGSQPDSPFTCKNVLHTTCSSNQECRAPQQKRVKPQCPPSYCGEPNVHSPARPVRPGSFKTLPWDTSFYPPRNTCTCYVTCPEYACIQGRCQAPVVPPPDTRPPPDPVPQCPTSCKTDADCPAKLCQDRIRCIELKCINPFIQP